MEEEYEATEAERSSARNLHLTLLAVLAVVGVAIALVDFGLQPMRSGQAPIDFTGWATALYWAWFVSLAGVSAIFARGAWAATPGNRVGVVVASAVVAVPVAGALLFTLGLIDGLV